ncbi:acetyl-CoA C-acetyltransferase [Paraburkholderia silvatlantica]|uniref:Acetyl-CoA C-acetyltransferase n=1 Tax=Paraburkholderia silvatlantica TaxID=321895 RepID=A0ABR6FX72_9BURK|nr:acetyl-CoA C-acetyltransferase [Paraburkholderia silvatlantica]
MGKFGGRLRNVDAGHLAAVAIKGTVDRSGVPADAIDDVIFSQSYSNGETPCIGRWAALAAGLPVELPGMQLDRRCGGGLQAILTAAALVQSGAFEVVLAGGVESMSNIEYYTTDMRWGTRSGSSRLHDRLERGRERSQPEARFGYISGMIETAENVAREFGITREQADIFALSSHRLAAEALKASRFAEEIVPVVATNARGEEQRFQEDEGIREGLTIDALAALRPILPEGTVTAGNASQQSDAAAACLVVSEDRLDALGLTPMAFVTDWTIAGCDPRLMGIAPVPAVEKLRARTGLSFDDFDLVEINEAFACQVLAVLKKWDWFDTSRLNVNGSGISLGHPIGATGARILTTLLYELHRRKGRFALETMCIGGGQGIAAIFERAI